MFGQSLKLFDLMSHIITMEWRVDAFSVVANFEKKAIYLVDTG